MQQVVRKHLISTLTTVAFLLTVGGFLVWAYLTTDDLGSRSVAKYPEVRATKLWFASTNQLVGTRVEDGTLRVWSLQPGGDGVPTRYLLDVHDASGPVSVSREGTRAVWIAGGKLHSRHVASAASAGTPVDVLPGSTLAVLTGTDAAVVVDPQGEVRIFDAASLRRGKQLHINVHNADFMDVRERYVAIASRTTGEMCVLTVRNADDAAVIETRFIERNFGAAVVSPAGRMIAVYDATLRGAETINGPGTVQLIDFYDDGTLAVAGDFYGIHHIGPGKVPRQVASTTSRPLAAATNSKWLAVAYPGGTEVFGYRLMNRWKTIPDAFILAMKLLGLFVFGILARYLKNAWKWMLLNLLPKGGGAVLKGKREKPAYKGIPDVQQPPDDLKEAVANRECVLFGGEELSRNCGMPVWNSFLLGFNDWLASVSVLKQDRAEEIRALHRQNKLGSMTAALRTTIAGREHLAIEYAQALYLKPAPLTRTHEALLYVPFCAAMTPNLDRLIERVIQPSSEQMLTLSDCGDARAKLAERKLFLMKLRGMLDCPESVTVWLDEALQQAGSTPEYAAFLADLLNTRTLLMVGVSLDEVALWFDAAELGARPKRKHYAIISTFDSSSSKKAQQLHVRFNIEVMKHPPQDTTKLVQFLQKLTTEMKPVPPSNVSA